MYKRQSWNTARNQEQFHYITCGLPRGPSRYVFQQKAVTDQTNITQASDNYGKVVRSEDCTKSSTPKGTLIAYYESIRSILSPMLLFWGSGGTVESQLNVQVGTQKLGRRTERDVQEKIFFRVMPC